MFQEIAGKVYRSIHEGGYIGSVTVSALSETHYDFRRMQAQGDW